MKLICESLEKEDYTQELPEVNFTHPLIQQKVRELKSGLPHSSLEYIKKAYEFVRDEVSHSWDIQSRIITKTASEALKEKEGICYSKCNLLAALLRAEGIPTGFCYQKTDIWRYNRHRLLNSCVKCCLYQNRKEVDSIRRKRK